MKKCFRNGKKANVSVELLTIIVVLVIFALASVFGAKLLSDINGDIQEDTEMSDTSKEMIASQEAKFPTLFDNLFLFIYVMLIVFVLVSSFFIDSNPIFFIIAILLLISIFVVALLIGNTYDDIVTEDGFSQYANEMPYMSWVMRHLAESVIGIGFMLSIAMFAKHKLIG